MTGELATIRDFFRYAVTSFTRAGLRFGHGSTNAIDEAAFLILEGLSLPIDNINPWLDARLTSEEQARLSALINERVTTRKPAAYLVNKAYIQGVSFYIDERVIVPRSYIGEILASDASFLPEAENVGAALDLCTGSGCLAILAALSFPDATIAAADLSADALEVAARNVADHGLDERISLHQGDLFTPLHGRKFDLILANPPYVDAGAVAAFPPEYRAEPVVAHAGGADGLDIVRRIIAEAPQFLTGSGGLLCEIGTGREILEREFPRLPFFWPDTEESEGEVFWLGAKDLER
jgi:ribosomal protein L3 glutamine methyltransferase